MGLSVSRLPTTNTRLKDNDLLKTWGWKECYVIRVAMGDILESGMAAENGGEGYHWVLIQDDYRTDHGPSYYSNNLVPKRLAWVCLFALEKGHRTWIVAFVYIPSRRQRV